MGKEKNYVRPKFSLPKGMLERIDKTAEALGLSRSGFIRFLFIRFLRTDPLMEKTEHKIRKEVKKIAV